MQMSCYEAQLMVRVFVEERRSEAARQGLLRQVKRDRPRWLVWQGLALRHRLGCTLIDLGQRLQRPAIQQTGVLGSEERARP